MEPILLSRRGLLVSFALGATFGGRPGMAQTGRSLDANEVDSFLAIGGDGAVTIYTSKVDVGTGVATAICQMAAEELGIPMARFSVVQGDTALTPDHGGTGGSSGVPRGGVHIRQAAATAREALLNMAAERLKRPAAELTLADGRVQPGGITIASLIGGKRLALKIDPKAPMKKPAEYTVVGKPFLRPDVPAKCTGRQTYIQDFSVPGMLHGRVVRPPGLQAKLLSVDESSIRGIPDVRVVRIESFLGVVAKDEWAAIRAARELKAQWSDWRELPGSDGLERFVREGEVGREQTIVNRGDAASALQANGAKQLSATYYWPFQSHASLGPSCAVADVREEGTTTIWTSSQGPHNLRKFLAKMFGIPAEKMRVVFVQGAGSYGRNGNDDAAADALLLSRAVKQPVRVQWMREDEHGWDPKGPAQLLDVKGALDAEGRIAAWQTEMWIPGGPSGAPALVGPEAAGIPQGRGQSAGQMTQNGDPPYRAEHVRVLARTLKDTPLRLSNLRAPGKIGNVFAVESFTDELAAAAGIDALEFRLRGLSDARAIAVLQKAAEMIGWQKRPSPNRENAGKGMWFGRGMAYVHYKQAENHVAIAMEVMVDRANGKIVVRRVTCAHDCGLIVNPDGLRNQVEGNILQTLSRTLHEEVQFDQSRVTSVDWAGYPILRFNEAPAIEVALIDKLELPPLGAGEAASAPVAAALGNAVFDATGVRLRKVPFTREHVLAEV
ncbi:MAG TPA: molybdopterin cofactor-binding domain-containing protein [Bryobacteraceae bacterium]